jgi:hypothetical protein
MNAWRLTRPWLLAALTLGFAPTLLGACSSSGQQTGSKASASSATPSWESNQAVLQAWTNAQNAAAAAETEPGGPNPAAPALARYWSGDALGHLQALIASAKAGGYVFRGNGDLGRPRVLTLNGATAEVTSCIRGDLLLTDPKTGQPVSQSSSGQPAMDGIRSTLSYTPTTGWQIVATTSQSFAYDGGHGTCPGY